MKTCLVMLAALAVAGAACAQGLTEYGMVTGGAGGGGIGAGGLAGSVPSIPGVSGSGGGGGGGGGIAGLGGGGGGGGGGGASGTGASSGGLKLHDPETIAYVAKQIRKRPANRVYAIADGQYYHRYDHLTFEEWKELTVADAVARGLAPCPECVPPASQAALDREIQTRRTFVAPQYRAYLTNRSPMDEARLAEKP